MNIDWEQIETLMRAAIRGDHLDEHEQRLITVAHATDPQEYGKRHCRVKQEEQEEVDRMRSGW